MSTVDTVTVGGYSLEVIHLRGHTPGSITLLYRDGVGRPHLFTRRQAVPRHSWTDDKS